MRRLYVGGLNHAVTQKDLKDRFGKFGDVLDVELRTRRDEEGENASSRCLSVETEVHVFSEQNRIQNNISVRDAVIFN